MTPDAKRFQEKTRALRTKLRDTERKMHAKGKTPLVFDKVTLEEFREKLLTFAHGHDGQGNWAWWTCHYCRAHLAIDKLTLDHAIPASAGGLTDFTNLVPSCQPCNRRKGHMTAEDFRLLMAALDNMTNRGRASVTRRLTARVQFGWNKAKGGV